VLRDARHVEGREADLVALPDALRPEELLAPVEPAQGILATIKGQEGKLVVAWNADGLIVFMAA
jgi:hypothetical protein